MVGRAIFVLFFCHVFIVFVPVCAEMHPCASVWVWLYGRVSGWGWWVTKALGTWRSGDDQTGQYSAPCLTSSLQALQEALCKAFLFPFVVFVTQGLSPCISSFEVSARSFSNNLRTCFSVLASLFSSMFGMRGSPGTPCFIVLHRYWGFYKWKTRPCTSKRLELSLFRYPLHGSTVEPNQPYLWALPLKPSD